MLPDGHRSVKTFSFADPIVRGYCRRWDYTESLQRLPHRPASAPGRTWRGDTLRCHDRSDTRRWPPRVLRGIVLIRNGTPADEPFLREFLYLAVFVPPGAAAPGTGHRDCAAGTASRGGSPVQPLRRRPQSGSGPLREIGVRRGGEGWPHAHHVARRRHPTESWELIPVPGVEVDGWPSRVQHGVGTPHPPPSPVPTPLLCVTPSWARSPSATGRPSSSCGQNRRSG
jgi:hypothetical protein